MALNIATKSSKRFLITGANSHIGYPLIRALNIKYNAKNIYPSDIKSEPIRSFGAEFIPNLDVLDAN
jgi:hypothetical protein